MVKAKSERPRAPLKARYIMVGGFLGAGKTTAVSRLAAHLTGHGYSVGLITNDQSSGLADTTLLRSQGYPVEEVAGGCFCCRFGSLHEAADKLSENQRPDFFLAEPVGSCTDLVATVSYPLRRIYGESFSIGPLSVLLDSKRAARMFGLTEGKNFSSAVRYVYRKQIEEADIVVLNKIDLIDDSLQQKLRTLLSSQYPDATVIACSARDGINLENWFLLLEGPEDAHSQRPLQIDYGLYARGEAALGWLNATLRVNSSAGMDGNRLITELSGLIQKTLDGDGCSVAHLKMTLDPGFPSGEIAMVSVVHNESRPELRATLLGPVSDAQLIINLRAEAAPASLESAAKLALNQLSQDIGFGFSWEDIECFRPAAPSPQHRFTRETAENAVETTGP